MATVVVSGRVDEEVKLKVDRVLERAGKTPAEVIKDMWVNISITGKLPTTQQQIDEFKEKRRKFHEFIELVESLPPAPEWFATMTDREMNDMIAEDQMRKWGYV